jgi:N-acetyltransferase
MTPDFQPVLDGEWVRLRALRADDFEALYGVASDPEIWAQHPVKTRWQRPVFQAFFDEGLASGGSLTVSDAKTGAVIGHSRYSTEFTLPGEVEIGWSFLARSHWGGLYNGEMKRLMLDHMFRYVPQVMFRIGEANLRSRKAVEKIGGMLTDRTQVAETPGGPRVNVIYTIRRAV